MAQKNGLKNERQLEKPPRTGSFSHRGETRRAIAEFDASRARQGALEAESTGGRRGYVTTNYTIARRGRRAISRADYLRQGRVLKILEKTSQYLAVASDITTILEKIAETVVRSLGAKQANFWDFTPDRRGVFIRAAYGMQRQYMAHSKKDPIPVGAAWIGRAVATGQAWATSDARKDPLLPKSWLPAVKKQNYHGLLCVPVMRKKEIIGGMCLYHKNRHEYQFFELDVMTIVANQAATALENARIFGDLNAERDKTLAIIQSLNDGLIMYDREGRVELVNPRVQEMLWVDAGEILGKVVDATLAAQSVYLKNLFGVRELKLSDYETKEFTAEGPQRVVLRVTQIPVHDQKKELIGAMHIFHDITREKEVEQLKSGFISTASHQMRTPLAGMKWSLARFLDEEVGPLNTDQKKLMQETYRTTEHMIALVNDLLDAARIEEGRYGYTFLSGDFAVPAEKTVETLLPNAEKQKIQFTFEKTGAPLPKTNFDSAKLEIAIQNIVDNALKYTKPGGSVSVSFQTDSDTVSLVVSDTGIGIPKKDQKFIFNKFFRAENAIRFQTDGSGLGLYIAEKIVEKHNGTITFTSEEGNGSTFFLRLPRDQAKMPKGVIEGM